MSWYLFNNSPEQQLRGKKVDIYQNIQRPKLILDWGLGQLSPKKPSPTISTIIQQQSKTNTNSQHQKYKHPIRNLQKTKAIQQTIKVLTESSDQEGKQELIQALNNYSKKKDKQIYSSSQLSSSQYPFRLSNHQNINKSLNVLNPIVFETVNNARLLNKPVVDFQVAKRMRFLQSSLLPENKRDNMSAVLDYDLNEKVGTSLDDSRLSRKSKSGNKKNQSAVPLGNGFNAFVPLKQKVKDMNQKLKEMYDYDQWCKRRQTSQIRLG